MAIFIIFSIHVITTNVQDVHAGRSPQHLRTCTSYIHSYNLHISIHVCTYSLYHIVLFFLCSSLLLKKCQKQCNLEVHVIAHFSIKGKTVYNSDYVHDVTHSHAYPLAGKYIGEQFKVADRQHHQCHDEAWYWPNRVLGSG